MSNKQKTRVAFFSDLLVPGSDGAIRTIYQLIDRIDKNEFEFLFICGNGPDAINGFKSVHVPTLTLPFNASYGVALPAFSFNALHSTLKAFAPHVIHISTPSFLGWYAIRFAEKNMLPVLSICHTNFISYIHYYLKSVPFLISPVRLLMERLQCHFYNRSSIVYVPSRGMEMQLQKTGVYSSKMKFWQRGIDTLLFNPERKDPKTLRAITGNDHPTIFFASRLVWEKNLETLIRIYDLLQQRNLPYNMVIAGGGVAMNSCKLRMPKAKFLGYLSHTELSVLYASCSVFVFPSISETFGNVVLEAMASGLPCVIADGGGSSEFIEDGYNGFKCPPMNANAYLEKIMEIIENPLIASSLSRNAVGHSKRYSWEQLSSTYFKDLHLLKASPPASHKLFERSERKFKKIFFIPERMG